MTRFSFGTQWWKIVRAKSQRRGTASLRPKMGLIQYVNKSQLSYAYLPFWLERIPEPTAFDTTYLKGFENITSARKEMLVFNQNISEYTYRKETFFLKCWEKVNILLTYMVSRIFKIVFLSVWYSQLWIWQICRLLFHYHRKGAFSNAKQGIQGNSSSVSNIYRYVFERWPTEREL